MDNGKHLCRSQHLEGLRLQILSDSYEGNVSICTNCISSQDFIDTANNIAKEFDVRLDIHTDKDSIMIRLNRGLPLNIKFGSDTHRDFLVANPSFLKKNAIWHNIFYNLSISD